MLGATERAVISVDVVCFALRGETLSHVLIQRAVEPFAGDWALPGGAVLPDEPLDAAAARLLRERTGLTSAYLEQLYTFGAPERDPRGRTLSVAYFALLPAGDQPTLLPGRAVRALDWFAVDALPHLALAFDHGQIADYARWRLSQKLTYTPLAFHVLPKTFTLGDLRLLHEAVDGRRYDPSNFQKQMLARWDLAPLSGVKDRRSRRPARLYRYIGAREIAGHPRSPTIHAPAPPAESEET
jgi:8-oxo-dGTP diphosphatase